MTQRPDRARIRSQSRHKVNVPLSATLARDGKPMKFTGTVVQFGPGGITAEINADLELGEQLALDFVLPYSQVPLKISAIVRNRSAFRYGLEFQDPTPDQRSAIQRLCDTLALLEG
jgi:PilZ domain